MVKSILLYFGLLFSSSALGCWGSANQNISVDQDTVQVIQTVNFCLGSGPTCPPLESYDFQINGSTITIDFYYNMAGEWPANFCQRVDTVREFLNNGSYILIVNSFIIDFDTTYVAESDTHSTLTVGINESITQETDLSLDASSGQFTFSSEADFSGKFLQVYDAQGNEILHHGISNSATEVIPTNLDIGIYFFTVSDAFLKPGRVRIIADE